MSEMSEQFSLYTAGAQFLWMTHAPDVFSFSHIVTNSPVFATSPGPMALR